MNDIRLTELLSKDDIKIFFTHFRVPGNKFEEAIDGPPRKRKYYLRRYSRKRGFITFDITEYKNIRPATKGGYTSCVIRVRERTFNGIGACSFDDTFCYATGREYAFDRAYEKFVSYLIEQEALYA